MIEKVPYLQPPDGPLRTIAGFLENGLLQQEHAEKLIEQGLPETLIGLYVEDVAWWKKREHKKANGLSLNWEMNAWHACLHFETEGLDLWIDPGPAAPLPEKSPDLILVTHAHYDHTARLKEYLQCWPDVRVGMTALTEQLLCQSNTELKRLLKPCLFRLDENQPRTIFGVNLCAYSAGHLLGAAMFSVRFHDDDILISGDFAFREVGGLAGAVLPQGKYDLLVMEATTPGRGEMPVTDLATTRQALLQQVQELVNRDKTSIVVQAQALGQAQEIYAALVTAQRAGAFPQFTIYLHGHAAKIAKAYEETLCEVSGPWRLPILEADQLMMRNSVTITSESISLQDLLSLERENSNFSILHNPSVFTHGSWCEHMAMACFTSCKQVALYHGGSLSLASALKEVGCELISL